MRLTHATPTCTHIDTVFAGRERSSLLGVQTVTRISWRFTERCHSLELLLDGGGRVFRHVHNLRY